MNKPCTTCKDIFNCNECEKIKKYNFYLNRKRKYQPSDDPIRSIDELLKTEMLWCWGKPVHRSVFISMTLRTVMQFIQFKRIYKAELKQKPVDQQQ